MKIAEILKISHFYAIIKNVRSWLYGKQNIECCDLYEEQSKDYFTYSDYYYEVTICK